MVTGDNGKTQIHIDLLTEDIYYKVLMMSLLYMKMANILPNI